MKRGLPLFWKVLFTAAMVSLVPLVLAMVVSVGSAIDTAEDLLKKNLLLMSRQVAQRTSYTLVSIDSDLDVMGELEATPTALATFSHGQRRELYSVTNGERRLETVPKYREAALYAPDGEPLVVVVDDEAVAAPERFAPGANRWCEPADFVQRALENPGQPVVSGLVGCAFAHAAYVPAGGRLGQRFDGGVRVSKALVGPDGDVRAVATLVLSQLHLNWALESVQRPGEDEELWGMMVDRDGWVVAAPDPAHIAGFDDTGMRRAAAGWSAAGSINVRSLSGAQGAALAAAVEQANAGAPSTTVIPESQGNDWVAAVHPIEAELGTFSAARPVGAVMVLYPRDRVLQVTDDLRERFVWLIGVTALLVLLGSAVLAGNISRPIRRLADAARALARGESAPVPTRRRDEIGALARAFDRMQHDLEVSREGLLRAERLAAIGRFVSGIVHETKNVLAGLGNYVTLLERKVDPALKERLLPPMRRALDQLDKLVVRLRELSLEPRFAQTDLAQVIAHAAELVESQIRNKNIDLVMDLPETLEVPRADGSLLGQVFLNLLINAVEATPRDGRIEVRAATLDGELRVTVRDTGPGLPDVALEQLLEPFYTTKAGGTGLGLYISTSIIERHNGTLRITNHEEGGAVVEVRLGR